CGPSWKATRPDRLQGAGDRSPTSLTEASATGWRRATRWANNLCQLLVTMLARPLAARAEAGSGRSVGCGTGQRCAPDLQDTERHDGAFAHDGRDAVPTHGGAGQAPARVRGRWVDLHGGPQRGELPPVRRRGA